MHKLLTVLKGKKQQIIYRISEKHVLHFKFARSPTEISITQQYMTTCTADPICQLNMKQ